MKSVTVHYHLLQLHTFKNAETTMHGYTLRPRYSRPPLIVNLAKTCIEFSVH